MSREQDIEVRNHTLRAAIDWSYQLLPPPMQRFFARLSVFRGGWTVEAAQAVCKQPQASEYLLALQECSLIFPGDSDAADALPARFQMLEALREYALDKLAPGEQSMLQRRHADFFLQVAAQAATGIRGPQQADWLDRLEAEHDNLRAVLQWTREHNPDVGLRLATSLSLFWDIRGQWREGYRWLMDMLHHNQNAEPALRAKALLAASNLAKILGY